MPAISVIVPLYNKATTVVRALNSVFLQSFQDFEVVVVDDGSTDGGCEVVLENFTDRRLKLIRQENCGPGAARNRGVRESTSPCMAFLDADDELLPAFLEQNLANLRQHPECALSICASWRGAEKSLWSAPHDIDLENGVWRMPPDLHPLIVRWSFFSFHGSVFVQREKFLTLGGFYEERATFGEDSYLWLQALLKYAIYREPSPLMWYHTEDAELNLHLTQDVAADERTAFFRNRPLLPFLVHPERIRHSCPPEYAALLERYLAFEAMAEALVRTSVADSTTALDLIQRFPLMRSFKSDFAKLRAKLAVPQLASWISAARRFSR